MRQHTNESVKRKIFAAMLLAPFIPVVLALGTGGFLYWKTVQESQFIQLQSKAAYYAQLTDQYLEGCLGDLRFLDTFMQSDPKTPGLRTVLAALQGVHRDFIDIALLDQEGVVQAYAGPFVLKGSSINSGTWMRSALERGRSISEIQIGVMGTPHYLIAHRIRTDSGNMILRVAVDPVGLLDMLAPSRDHPDEIVITSKNGSVVADSTGQALTQDRVLSKVGHGERLDGIIVDEDTSTVYASHPLRTVDWILSVRTHSSTPLKNDAAISLFFCLFIVIGGIIVLLSSLYLSGYVDKMLQQRDGEREKLRDQLYRAGRLAELGEMAAGFAHEINNPLQIMKSDQAYIEMVLQDCMLHCGENEDCKNDMHEIQTSVAQIKLQIDRCARITHSILRFGRAGNVDEHNVDLVLFIPEVLTMIQKKAHLDNIALHVDIGAEKLLVHVDPGRLQQVLLNLLNNAMYAVLERKDGMAREIRLSCHLDQSGRVLILIRDNGVGISPENQKLIFTPFFTTKPPGSGTGLGLSVCHGIVDSMNGILDFVSVRGEGTTFSISLPHVASPYAANDSLK